METYVIKFSCWLLVFLALVYWSGTLAWSFVFACSLSVGAHGIAALVSYWRVHKFVRQSLEPGAGLRRR